jgi:putative addiction module killer protein
MKELEFFELENGKIPVQDWIASLDSKTQSRIMSRLERISEGIYGDVKKLVKSELSEIRFDFGKGYRIYFKEVKNVIVLLLNSGDKSTQTGDIKKAEKYFKIWKEYNNDQKI